MSQQQQQQGSHIPKFGSWDSDNVPYTAYFENARKDKGSSVKMNPNDPEENPEAFMMLRGGSNDGNFDKKTESTKSMMSQSGSDNSIISDYSNNKQSYKSGPKKSSNERSSNFYPPSPGPNRPKHGYNPADDIASHRSASVPMFGAWDEKDPRSGEGFTVIFQKVKEEKHIAASKFPPIPQQPTHHPNPREDDNKRSKKWCCCLF